MSKEWFVVWDHDNETEEFASGFEAYSAEQAAEMFLNGCEPDYPDSLVVRCCGDGRPESSENGRIVVIAVDVDYQPVFHTTERPFYGPVPRDPDMMPRPPGCRCFLEEGDSACPVHPCEEEDCCTRPLSADDPIGTSVIVTRDDGSKLHTVTRSEQWEVSGHPVVKVDGIVGCYLVSRCVVPR